MFVMFAATDWLDGFLARKLNQTSSFGAFPGPGGRQVFGVRLLAGAGALQRADVFVALIIIGREIAISALREWMALIGATKSVAVHMIGKIKTTVQMVAIPFLLFDGIAFRAHRHACLGNMADLDFGHPDGLVHGLLPAKSHSRNSRPHQSESTRIPFQRHCRAKRSVSP